MRHTIAVFSAGCPACARTVELVHALALPGCALEVLDVRDPGVADRAVALGIRSVPAVLVDGKLAICRSKGGVAVVVGHPLADA